MQIGCLPSIRSISIIFWQPQQLTGSAQLCAPAIGGFHQRIRQVKYGDNITIDVELVI